MDTTPRKGPALRAISAIWRGLDRLRRMLHLILLLGVFLLLLASAFGERVFVPSTAALVIAPEGALVDQLSGDPLSRAIAKARGSPIEETLLRDVLDALSTARDDDRIRGVVLQLDGMTGAGLSKLQELAAELRVFKQSGKFVTAIGDGFTRDQYYLASLADRVYMHPMGMVLIDGYSRFLPYYKSALEKFYVDYNVWTVGEYKSFVEPITRDDMSPQDRESSGVFLSALWNAYQADVTSARRLPDRALQRYADGMVPLLEEAGGNPGKLAVDFGLVDELLTRDAMRQRIRDSIGAEQAGLQHPDDFVGIGVDDYLFATRDSALPGDRSSEVAVIVASGTILDGQQPPGSIGGDSLAELIRQARDNERVKALVLRVDSGGGSAFASDVILRELQVFQESNRPLVVSMGSVAASGGYWMSMTANEIWASPTTLTGSIGVGATIPTFQRLLDRIGVHVDGIGTTESAGAFDVTRELSDNVKGMIGQMIQQTYEEFIGKVAEHRERSVEQIDSVAHGRVWVGSDALERGLVDRLGTLAQAIESAAELAGLEGGSYGVTYVEPQLGFSERLFLELTATAMPAIELVTGAPAWQGTVSKWLESAMEPLAFLGKLNDPRGIYAYCFCDTQ
jgi:protease-4